jgi:hypothetical protein
MSCEEKNIFRGMTFMLVLYDILWKSYKTAYKNIYIFVPYSLMYCTVFWKTGNEVSIFSFLNQENVFKSLKNRTDLL